MENNVYRMTNIELLAVRKELERILGQLSCQHCLDELRTRQDEVEKECEFRLGNIDGEY